MCWSFPICWGTWSELANETRENSKLCNEVNNFCKTNSDLSSLGCPYRTREKCKLYRNSIAVCIGELLHIYAPSLVGTWTLSIGKLCDANNIHLQCPCTNFYGKSFEFNGAYLWNKLGPGLSLTSQSRLKKHLGRLFGSTCINQHKSFVLCFVTHPACFVLCLGTCVL